MDIREQIEAAKIVAIVRGNYVGAIRAITESLIAGGVSVIEMTLNSAGALDAIKLIAQEYGDKVLIGAGTVLESREVEQVVKAGGKFVISPALLPDVMQAAFDQGIESVPGTLTPTEIIAAHRGGARLIKVFPSISPDYLKTIRGPLHDFHLMPTGGVDASNARAYFDAGAVALGVGSALVPNSFDGSPEAVRLLTERARKLVEIAKSQTVTV